MSETPIEIALCSHAILENEFIEIEDTLKDNPARSTTRCATAIRVCASMLVLC